MTGPGPGWYPDPAREAAVRWFDGFQWTRAASNASGWYPDPRHEAPWRWFDGSVWTNTIHPPVTPNTLTPAAGVPEPRLSAERSPLSRLLGSAAGFAVLDVETTGVYNADRVVEIAIVTLDAAGAVVDEFDTIVNPYRDVGPTDIHGLTAAMVADAPAFEDIADRVMALLEDKIVVAHNIGFDTRLVGLEFGRLDIEIDWGTGLDTYSATRQKLTDACSAHGIRLEDAHCALADTRATAELVVAVADHFDGPALPAHIFGHTPTLVSTRILPRGALTTRSRSRALPSTDDAPAQTPSHRYTALLTEALADLKLTPTEHAELQTLAEADGLQSHAVTSLRRDFVNSLIDEALDDSVVTDDEMERLIRLAALLELDPKLVTARTNPYRFDHVTVELSPGLTVCFTGDCPTHTRDELRTLASEHGLVPASSVTSKGCRLLVATDPASQSTKAVAAHKFGIPIASTDDFLSALRSQGSVPALVLRGHGVACICERCGDSWTAARRSTTCKACKTSNTTRAVTKKRPDPTLNSPSGVDTLVCSDCAKTWDRPTTRGRKPHRCPECTGAATV